MSERFTFHEKGESASKVADSHANAFVSTAFLGEGNTLDNVEAGLSQQVGSGAHSSTRTQSVARECTQCRKKIVGVEAFEVEGKVYHGDCLPVLDKPCAECSKIILRPPYSSDGAGNYFHPDCAEQRRKYGRNIQTVKAPKMNMKVS